MMRFLCTSFLYLGIYIICPAKEKNISGNVKYKGGQPAVQSNVFITDTESNIVVFTFCDTNGNFNINFPNDSNLILNVSSLGFLPYSQIIDDKLSYPVNIILEESFTEINEITIKSGKEHLDTVKVNLNQLFLNDNDNLSSILSKSPNFLLDKNGSIIYNGKNIDKILIDGKVYFEYQNSIALEKIENRMISSLQVVNNYKDPFSLDLNSMDETVLNIKSRNSFKDIFSGAISGGTGSNYNYVIDGSIFKFGDSFNGFLTNKTNNIGHRTVQFREMEQLFIEDMPFSIYLKESTNKLFQEQNRRKDFVSNTNLSLKKTSEKVRLKTKLYYFDKAQENNLSYQIFNNNKDTIDHQNKDIFYKSKSILGRTDLDILTNNQGLFSVTFNLVNNNNNSSRLISGLLYNKLHISEYQNINNISSSARYKRKINDKRLLSFETSLYYEETSVDNKIVNLERSKLYLRRHQPRIYGEIQKKISSTNTISIGFQSSMLNETSSLNYETEKRYIYNSKLGSTLTGKKVFNKVDYIFQIGIEDIKVNDSNRYFLIPYKVNISFENRLSRWYLTSSYTNTLNPIILNYSSRLSKGHIVTSTYSSITPYKKVYNTKIGYSYNNILNGKNFRLKVAHLNIKKDYKELISKVNPKGIEYYKVSLVPEYTQIKTTGSLSILTFRYNKYPLKVSLNNNNTFETLIYEYDKPLNLKTYQLGTDIMSISNKIINIEFGANLTIRRNNYLKSHYINTYIKPKIDFLNISSFICYNQTTFIELSNQYNYHGLDFEVLYKLNKFHFKIHSKNLNNVLGISNNRLYDTRHHTTPTYNTITHYNAAMSYLLFELKYNF